VPQGDTVPAACMVVNGCYVEVPFNAKFSPPISFTVEAWVRPDWTADDPHAFRFVLDMRELASATAGFGICALALDDQPGVYKWRGIVGDGSGTFSFADSSEALVTLKDPAASAGTVAYVALTYDGPGKTLTLFVDGTQQAQLSNVGYLPNATQPLWIGAGAPYIPRRTQPAGVDPASPLFPFVGAIQDVAFYNAALTPDVIATHHLNGSGLM
jgi:Concanavalin A-like lectin/glucanases superfamily